MDFDIYPEICRASIKIQIVDLPRSSYLDGAEPFEVVLDDAGWDFAYSPIFILEP